MLFPHSANEDQLRSPSLRASAVSGVGGIPAADVHETASCCAGEPPPGCDRLRLVLPVPDLLLLQPSDRAARHRRGRGPARPGVHRCLPQLPRQASSAVAVGAAPHENASDMCKHILWLEARPYIRGPDVVVDDYKLTAAPVSVLQDSPHKWRLDKWANDLSCAVFSLANVVTIMYYIVDTSTHVRCYCAPSRW